MFLDILIILVLIALNGFFVSVEFAAVASRRHRIAVKAKEGNKAAQIVKRWLDSPAERDRLLAATQLGITIVSLALGAVGEKTFEHAFAPWFNSLQIPDSLRFLQAIIPSLPLLASLTIVTSFHVVLGEQVPKVATLHAPEKFALRAAYPMWLFETVFSWFVDVLDWATRATLRLLGLQPVTEHGHIGLEELRQIVSETKESGQLPESGRLLTAVLDFNELLVRQVMVPRTEIVAVEADAPLAEVITLFSQYPFTKFPVYEGELDNIIGIMHIKEMVRYWKRPDFEQMKARDIAREPLFVPETLPVSVLLHRFRESRQHIAIVVDEYGGTAGLVTLEDLLEEIVGEVSDQFDQEPPEIQSLPDGSYLVDGRTLLEDVNEQLSTDLSTPYYDTIAGFVLDRLGRIPQVGDTVEEDGVRITVEKMDGLRIERLRIERVGNDEQSN